MWRRLPVQRASNRRFFCGPGWSRSHVLGLALLFIAGSLFPTSQGLGQLPLDPIPVARPSQEIALQILFQSLHEAVWGLPALSDVRQSIQLRSHQMTGFGKYVRGGQGTGKMRMSLQLPAGDQMNTLLQVSDGELLVTQELIGSVSQRSRVDLGKVRERLVITTDSLNDPVIAMYLAIGGQAEVLRKLCQQYYWVKVEEGKLGAEPVWWLTGKLAGEPPRIRAMAEVDTALFVPNQSALLPTETLVAIGRREASVPFWLFQIEQFRSSEGVTDLGHRAQLSVATEWASPTLLTPKQLTEDLFESKLANEHFVEETKIYLPPNPASVLAPQVRQLR